MWNNISFLSLCSYTRTHSRKYQLHLIVLDKAPTSCASLLLNVLCEFGPVSSNAAAFAIALRMHVSLAFSLSPKGSVIHAVGVLILGETVHKFT